MKPIKAFVIVFLISLAAQAQVDSMNVTMPSLVLQARDVNYITNHLKFSIEDLHAAFNDDWRDGTIPGDSTNTTAGETPTIGDLVELHKFCIRIPYGHRAIANRIITQLEAYNNPFLNARIAENDRAHDRERFALRKLGEFWNRRKIDRQ